MSAPVYYTDGQYYWREWNGEVRFYDGRWISSIFTSAADLQGVLDVREIHALELPRRVTL